MNKQVNLYNLLVSIIVPAYNCEKYIEETLNCLLNQTWEHKEIILVNDGSTDATLAIAKSFEKRGIKLIEQKNSGAASARNRGFIESSGERIIFFDADDFVGETFIESQILSLGSDDNCVCVSAWGRFNKEDKTSFIRCTADKEFNLTFSDWIKYYWRNNIHNTPPGRVIIPRSLIEKSGLWSEKLSLNDDFLFFTKIFSNATIIKFNNKALFYYRSDVDGLSTSKSKASYTSYLNSLISATDIALEKFPDNHDIKRCCANKIQLFVYELYPDYPDLSSEAIVKISGLADPDYPFPCGGYTQLLTSLVGWKLTKRIKLLF